MRIDAAPSFSTRILDLLVYNPSGEDVSRALALDFGLKYDVTEVCITLYLADGSVFCLGDYGVTPSRELSILEEANISHGGYFSHGLSLKSEFFGWNPDRTAILGNMKVRSATVGSIVMRFQSALSEGDLVELEEMMHEIIKPLTIFFFSRAPRPAVVPHHTAKVHPIRHHLLTERQKEILGHMASGRTNAHIADVLGYSVSTIRHETMRIYDLLSVSDRHEAGAKAIALGLISA